MKHKQREKGQSFLEFALILPVLLIILAGVLDLGRLYFSYVTVTDAAAEGAAYAAIHPGDGSEVEERALDSSNITADEGTVIFESSGDTVTVTVNYSFTLATPVLNSLVPDGYIPLEAVASEVILSNN